MLTDFIDIHSHALWGIDDGAKVLDESIDLCFCAEDSETKTLFLTPHLIYWDSAETLLDVRERKIYELQDILEKEGASLTVKKGFEILCDDDIFDVKHFLPYTLNESRYILIEFDFFKTTAADVLSWCKYLKSFGLIPIIAHPERYGFVSDDISSLDKLSDEGVLFQINAGSPAGVFGMNAAEISFSMLNNGYADFVGSDAHGMIGRNTDMSSLFDDYPYDTDENMLIRAAVNNPQCIVNDKSFFPIRNKKMAEI